MTKWLESGIGKAAGMILACLAAGGFVLSLVWLAAVPSAQPEDLLTSNGEQEFWESSTYRSELMQRARQELEIYQNQWMFREDGELNREASVDIGKVTGYDVEGLTYTLGDLLDWSDELSRGYGGEKVIVACKKSEGGKAYFYLDDFQRQLKDGSLQVVWKEDAEGRVDLDRIFRAWEMSYDQEASLEEQSYVVEYNGDAAWEYEAQQETEWEDVDTGEGYTEGITEYLDGIMDQKGRRIYTNFWVYQGSRLEERYAPEGTDSLLDIVNEKQWKLSDAFAAVSAAAAELSEQVQLCEDQKYEHLQDTNVQYLYVDLDQSQVFSNKEEYGKFQTWEKSLEQMKQMGSYTWLSKGAAGTRFDSNMKGGEEAWRHMVENPAGQEHQKLSSHYVFAVAVDTALPLEDWLYELKVNFQAYKGVMQKAVAGCAVCFMIFLAALVWLTWSAGHSRNKSGVALSFFEKWKTEAALALIFLVWALLLGGILAIGIEIIQPSIFREYLVYTWGNEVVTHAQMRLYTFVVLLIFSGSALVFLWGYLSLVRRWKAKILWKNSLLYLGLRQGKKRFLALKVIPKKAAALGGFLLILLFFNILVFDCSYGDGFPAFFLLFLVQAAGIGWIAKVAVEYYKIQKGIRKIADGDIAYQLPVKGLTLDRKIMAQDINRIGEGLDRAVEKSIKSERMKTELITNVSHDIKTPLTSIINYVDLLKKEQLPGEHVQEYLDILEKKSQQLKNLTEDVVEASKASTGNLVLQYDEMDLVEMVLQVNGEFQEKFEEKNLSLKLRLPEDTVIVWADGRRMWRILENIYQNAAKYAMPHTRVYVELSVNALRAVFTMKNISEQPLDISPDELTERFVRGDSSRNTQGSGLGLSIARSLTELQSGEFRLFLDGDLFKVQLSFPLRAGHESEES